MYIVNFLFGIRTLEICILFRIWIVPYTTKQKPVCKVRDACLLLINTFSGHISSNMGLNTHPISLGVRTRHLERDLGGPIAGGPTDLE